VEIFFLRNTPLSLTSHTAQEARIGAFTYTVTMARGWESKSVEEQQAAATAPHEWKQPLTPKEKAVRQHLEALQLSRKRILQQIEAAQNPRHRQVLENALADLNSRLARLV
jgi:hypothetical protein